MNVNFKNSFSSVRKFWTRTKIWLRVTVLSDGLEITDHAIRWCRIVDGIPQTLTMKIPPGVMQDGKIVDRDALIGFLSQIRETVSGPRPGTRKNLIVLTLGSMPTFMQLFYLPLMEHGRLEKAITLNLQMIAPSDGAATNAGGQILGEDTEKSRFEVAGVFIDRALMDDMVGALREGGFVVVAAESKALSLARVLARGESGFDPKGAYIMISCDDTSMDLMIVRKGILCFAYAIPWREIVDEQGEVSQDHFGAALTRGMRQIVNFYEQHWSDPITAVVVVANNLLPTIQGVLAAIVPYATIPFMAGEGDTIREALVAFGAALRGLLPNEEDHDMTLLESDASEIYVHEKIDFFLKFWRVILPAVLGFVVVAALVGDIFWFGKLESTAKAGAPIVATAVTSRLSDLVVSAQQFNQEVAMIQGIQASGEPKSATIARFETAAASSSITITRLTIGAAGTPITLTGTSLSESAVLTFKNDLISSLVAKDVALPLSGIQPQGTGYVFTMTVNR
jgi:hypothetical protein